MNETPNRCSRTTTLKQSGRVSLSIMMLCRAGWASRPRPFVRLVKVAPAKPPRSAIPFLHPFPTHSQPFQFPVDSSPVIVPPTPILLHSTGNRPCVAHKLEDATLSHPPRSAVRPVEYQAAAIPLAVSRPAADVHNHPRLPVSGPIYPSEGLWLLLGLRIDRWKADELAFPRLHPSASDSATVAYAPF